MNIGDIKTKAAKTLLSATIAFISVFPLITSAATFNTDIQDHPTILLANYTKNQGCTTCWSSYVTADPGDIISFLIYYHNTSAEVVQGTRLRITIPTLGFTSATITGQVITRDGTGASDNATLIVSSKQTLSFIPGSTRWYPQQTFSPAPPEPLLAGQTGIEIMTPGGLYIGELAPGWGDQGHLIFRAQLKNDAETAAPTVVTNLISGSSQYSASVSGTVNANNSDTQMWVEWGTASLEKSTLERSIGAGSYASSIFETLSGTRANAKYFYRIVASNAYGKTYGNTRSFTTDAYGNALVSYQPPSATAQSAETRSYDTSTIHAIVQPNGNDTDAWFEYGTTPTLGIQTPIQTISGDETSHAMSYDLTGLSAHTTYYYRIVTENPRGKTFGTILQFTTSSFPTSTQRPATGSAPGGIYNPAHTPAKGAPAPGQKPNLSFASIGAALDPSLAAFLLAIVLIIVGMYFAYRQIFRHAQPL